MLDKDDDRDGGYSGPIDLPDDHVPPPHGEEDEEFEQSLTEDILDLIDDGRTYLEAELAFQKSRGAFVADQAKGVIAFGLGAFAVLLLALIAATVGVVIALAPHVGPWGATAIVSVALVMLGAVFVNQVRKRLKQILWAMTENGK